MLSDPQEISSFFSACNSLTAICPRLQLRGSVARILQLLGDINTSNGGHKGLVNHSKSTQRASGFDGLQRAALESAETLAESAIDLKVRLTSIVEKRKDFPMGLEDEEQEGTCNCMSNEDKPAMVMAAASAVAASSTLLAVVSPPSVTIIALFIKRH